MTIGDSTNTYAFGYMDVQPVVFGPTISGVGLMNTQVWPTLNYVMDSEAARVSWLEQLALTPLGYMQIMHILMKVTDLLGPVNPENADRQTPQNLYF